MRLAEILPPLGGSERNHPRIRELRAIENRSPQDEAELRSYCAFPDNPSARDLFVKNYLTEQGLSKMSAEELADLRAFHRILFLQNELKEFGGMACSIEDLEKMLLLHFEINPLASPLERINEIVAKLPNCIIPVNTLSGAAFGSNPGEALVKLFLKGIHLIGDWATQRTNGCLAIYESIDCIRDEVRTKKFLLAIDKCMANLATRRQERINVLDAGCGAIPIMGIYAALLNPNAAVTCLELNPKAARFARAIVHSLGLQKQITVVNADAITYRPPQSIDLLISETMHSGLINEPIVPIMKNLVSFVAADGFTLPSQIELFAGLIPLNSLTKQMIFYKNDPRNSRYYAAGPWNSVMYYQPGSALDEINFTIDISELEPGIYLIYVCDRVSLFDESIEIHDSLITSPQNVLADGSNVQDQDPWILDLRNRPLNGKVRISYKPGGTLVGAGSFVP